ncbi:hypothetical protein MCEMSEM23_02001 [Rhabdaerophilaceae bacterium]
MPLNGTSRVSLPVLALTIAVTFSPVPAQAEEVVQIGGGRAILNLPARRPSVGLILIPGGDGAIGVGDEDVPAFLRFSGHVAAPGSRRSLMVEFGDRLSPVISSDGKPELLQCPAR